MSLHPEIAAVLAGESEGCIVTGDAMELLPVIPAVGLVLTDPPYGVAIDGSPWDKSIPLPNDWLYPLFGRATTILLTPGNGNQSLYPKPKWTLGWFRPGSVQLARAARCFSHWEPVLLYGENRFAYDAKQFSANTGAGGLNHPCAKPLAVFEWLVAGSKTAGVVFDPFCGSGTTCVAAKKLGRKYIGIEIDPGYAETARRRVRDTPRPLFTEANDAPPDARLPFGETL